MCLASAIGVLTLGSELCTVLRARITVQFEFATRFPAVGKTITF